MLKRTFEEEISSQKPTLWLVPNTLGFMKSNTVIAEGAIRQIHKIRHFLVESKPGATRMLKWIKHPLVDTSITMEVLDKQTPETAIPELLKPLKQGFDMGVLSEAGLPGVADPGNAAVRWAHAYGFAVSPISGPSSLFLAIAASGLNGQNFTFHGYLPDDPILLKRKVLELERNSATNKSTQLFIESPHRNDTTFQVLVESLQKSTLLCVACNVTLDDEFIQTKTIERWKTVERPDIRKKPTVFLFQSY